MPDKSSSPIKTLIYNFITNPKRVASIGSLIMLWQRTYFEAQKKVTTLEDALLIETKMDDRIPPEEHAIYAYLFACIFVAFVAAYMIGKITSEQFKKTQLAFRTLILESEKIFISHPTRMRDRLRMKHPLTLFTQSVDGPTNCFPSLHVSLVVLSYQIIKDDPKPEFNFVEGIRTSCIDICRSTLKTKQHSILDVIGGMMLANQIYLDCYGETVADLLPELLPELNSTELDQVRTAIKVSNKNPIAMMQELLQSWAA